MHSSLCDREHVHLCRNWPFLRFMNVWHNLLRLRLVTWRPGDQVTRRPDPGRATAGPEVHFHSDDNLTFFGIRRHGKYKDALGALYQGYILLHTYSPNYVCHYRWCGSSSCKAKYRIATSRLLGDHNVSLQCDSNMFEGHLSSTPSISSIYVHPI